MNYIDFIIITLLLLAAIIGIWKGFIHQLFGIAALFLGLYAAWHFSGFAASFISPWLDKNEVAVTIISFALTFVVVLFGVIFAGRLARLLVKMVALGLFDRLLGLLFSVVKMAFILSVSIWLLQAFDHLWPFFPHQDSRQSILFDLIAKLAPAVFPYLKSWFSAI